MDTTAKATSNTFTKNLELYVSENKIEKYFYFDTTDVADICFGIDRLYDNHRFLKKRFLGNEYLVQSLAAGGLLQQSVYMLPPHQDEFERLIERHFSTTSVLHGKPSTDIINNFLVDAQVYNKFDKKFTELSSIERKEFIINSASKSEDIYKSLFLCHKIKWKERIKYYFKEKSFIKTTNYKELKYVEIVRSSIFKPLLNTLDKIRPESKGALNNYYDAIALTYLSHQVDKYNNNETSTIPILYDSKGTFRDVIKESKLDECFCIRYTSNSKDYSSNVVRGDDYFLVYSIFNSVNIFKIDVSKINSSHSKAKEIITSHEKRVNEFLGIYLNKYNEENDAVIKNDILLKLNEELEEYRKYTFLTSVLIPLMIEPETGLHDTFINIELDTENYVNNQFIEELDQHVLDLKNNLKTTINKVDKYEYVLDLNSKIETFRKKFNASDYVKRPFKVLRDYTIIRVLLPEELSGQLEAIVGERGVLSKHSKVSDFHIVDLLEKLLDGLYNVGQGPNTNLVLGIGGLWVFEMYDEIVSLTNNKPLNDLSLLFFRSASILKRHPDTITEVLDLMKHILKNFNQENIIEKHIVLAHLNFNIWLMSGTNFTSTNEIPTKKTNSDYNLIAIGHAKTAYDEANQLKQSSSSVHSTFLSIYTLNVYLYYSVEGGTVPKFEEAKHLINPFISYTGAEVWNYRFDDTIARFYHRLSVIHKDLDQKKNLAKLAEMYIDMAYKNCNGNGTIIKYRTQLLTYISELYF